MLVLGLGMGFPFRGQELDLVRSVSVEGDLVVEGVLPLPEDLVSEALRLPRSFVLE